MAEASASAFCFPVAFPFSVIVTAFAAFFPFPFSLPLGSLGKRRHRPFLLFPFLPFPFLGFPIPFLPMPFPFLPFSSLPFPFLRRPYGTVRTLTCAPAGLPLKPVTHTAPGYLAR